MRTPAPPVFVLVVLALTAATAGAAPVPPVPPLPVCSDADAAAAHWAVSFGATGITPAAPLRLTYTDAQTPAPRRAVPVDYSDAYKVRARIHKYASVATLPVFGVMYVVGQDLYDHPGASESKKGLHGGLAATTGILFGVNTLSGAWNLWEGRKDTNHRGRRMVHGILMMAADAGFAATGLLAPDDEDGPGAGLSSDRRRTHRTVALTSMGVATASYLLMLFWGD